MARLQLRKAQINRKLDIAPFDPSYLFRSGEQGVWYDPSDLTTLFQDAAGTTPVTAVEQPVSLMLDKRLGGLNALGSELITNGDFSNGTTGWTGVNGTLAVVNGTLQITADGVNQARASQVITTVAGRWYEARATVWQGTGAVGVTLLISGIAESVVVTTTTPTAVVCRFLASGTTATVRVGSGGLAVNGTTYFADNVSVKEIPGNHAYTPSAASTSRPVLSARVNLLERTEDFGNAYWTKLNSTIASDTTETTDPSGGNTADKLRVNTTNGQHVVYRNSGLTANGVVYRASVYAKAGEYSWLMLGNVSDGATTFNLATGAKGNDIGTCVGSITGVGNGWYLCSIVYTSGGTFRGIGCYVSTGATDPDSTFAGANTTDGLYIWGADFRVTNDGVGLPVYQRVTTSTDYDTAGFPLYLRPDGSDDYMLTPSIDFSTVTSDGQTRRNLLTFPTALDNAVWTKTRSSVTANTTTAPDGTTTADKLVEDTTASATHPISVAYTTAASAYTLSVYVKAAGRSWVHLSLLSTNNAFGNFNLSNGTLGTIGSAATAGIEDVGNGWYRCRITATTAAGANTVAFYPASADNTVSYTGDGTSGLFLWGAQLETGTAAAAFQNIGTDKMTVVAGVRKLSDAAIGMVAELSVEVSLNNGAFWITAPRSVAGATFGWRSNGTLLAEANSPASYPAPITTVFTGIGDIANDIAIQRLNGTQVASSTSNQGTGNYGNYPLYLFRRGGTVFPFNGRCYGLVVRGVQSAEREIVGLEQWMNTKTKTY